MRHSRSMIDVARPLMAEVPFNQLTRWVLLVAESWEPAAGRAAPSRAQDTKHVEPGSVLSVLWESDAGVAE